MGVTTIEVRDHEAARRAHAIVCGIAGEIAASYETTDEKSIQAAIEQAVQIYLGVKARIKLRPPATAVPVSEQAKAVQS